MTLACFQRPPQKLKAALLVAVVVLANLLLAEGVARYMVVLGKPPESHMEEFDRKYQLARQKPDDDRPLLLFVGDSHMIRSVYPELLEERLLRHGKNLEVRNLGVTSNTPDMSLFLLKTAIEKGSKPLAVVYNISPRLVNKTYLKNEAVSGQQNFEATYTGSCIYKKPESLYDKIRCGLKKNMFLARHQAYIRAQLAALPEIVFKTGNLRKTDLQMKNVWELSVGGWSPFFSLWPAAQYRANFAIDGRDKARSMAYSKILFDQFQWSDDALTGVREYCRENNLPLILVWFPENPIRRPYYQHFNLSPQYFSSGFQKLAEPNHVWFVDLHDSDVDETHYYNTDHLNVLGAIAFSENLANTLASPPYVNLLQDAR